jgi:hypothetical protein
MRDHRLVSQLFPMDPIARRERDKPTAFMHACQSFKPLLLLHARPRVKEGRKVVADPPFVQNDIVLFGSVDFVQSELRLRPVNPITALAIPRHLRFIAIKLRPACITRVEPEQLAVLNHRSVFEIVRRLRHRRSQPRLMQFEVHWSEKSSGR